MSGTVDPWLYHAYFHRFPEFVSTLYPGTYYGTRLGWIVPGFAVYSIFPPHVANLVLHVGLFYVALAGIYGTVASLADRNSALFSAVAFGTFWQALIPMGWDYPDGAVMAYSAVALACVARAARSTSPVGWLAGAGAASAGMIHSNVGAVLLVPAAVASYLMRRERESLTRLGVHAAAWAAGATGATALLAVVNVLAGGPWLFFLVSIEWAINSMGTLTFTPLRSLGVPAISQAILPLIGVLVATALLLFRRSRLSAAAALPMLLSCGGLAVYDWISKGGTLQTQYYVSWLLVPAFIVISAAVHPLKGKAGVTRAILAGVVISAVNVMVAPRLGVHGDPDAVVQFDLVQQTLRFVSTRVPLERGRPVFWVEQGPANPFVSSLISTHLFLYSLGGAHFPTLPDDITVRSRDGIAIEPGSSVVIVSYKAPTQSAIESEFARFGLSARLGASEPIESGRIKLMLSVVDVGRLPR